MKLDFLSDEWFNKAKELREAYDDIGITSAIIELTLNVSVQIEDRQRQFHIKEGDAFTGHSDNAETTITLNYDLAKKLLLDADPSAAVPAFMAGEIKIEGDMSKLMMLQQHLSVDPTPEQKRLRDQILAITAV